MSLSATIPELSGLIGHRIGLVTNHTGRTRRGATAQRVLVAAGLHVECIFSPEHGPAGLLEGDVEGSVTPEGVVVHSLYGTTRRPTTTMLANLGAVVFDIQDVGARFYTYISTMAQVLEECARHNLPLVILDRPNPLGGDRVEGPVVDEAARSFVGYVQVPIVHGLTMGEVALFHARRQKLEVDLRVVRMDGWRRANTWDQNGLEWIAPSPNLPTPEAAAWYPTLCLLEFSGVSVGRGTALPFATLGAPWLDPQRVLEAMQGWPEAARRGLTGEPIEFVPTRAVYANELCHGIRFTSGTSAGPPRPVATGLALLETLHTVHPDEFDRGKVAAALPLIGSQAVLNSILDGKIEKALAFADADARAFASDREPILLY